MTSSFGGKIPQTQWKLPPSPVKDWNITVSSNSQKNGHYAYENENREFR